jgi:hypothetical protein
MTGIIILFAFAMSFVINLVEKRINPKNDLFTTHDLNETEAVSEVE